MIRSGLRTVDAQAKLAQSPGTTVASIQTLERAGELAGVSMSGIEQATKDLTRRLSQARHLHGCLARRRARLHGAPPVLASNCPPGQFAARSTDRRELPREHWTQIASTNPLERVNREIKRRTDTDVVGFGGKTAPHAVF
jgi:predicted transglutaminase-like cysteine proteinase